MRECDKAVKAAPGQQGWKGASVGRRDGGWCTCNSNSNDCRDEESPERERVDHRPQKEGKGTRETDGRKD